ncbi:MAG: zinc ABC transporter permease [Chloroflexi bacterium HGW-Chloroflexi-10]|nr:MAG: zinc ABC transporter permease [Chloroflexi bacterium HGW-Chloroflexi-10]
MTDSQIEIQLIAVITAAACALPGVILVLRRMSMMSDAISHTVLLGIVIGFFLVGDISSPFLIVGGAAIGVLTVSLVALLERTRLVKEDAAIGLVFPALFSIAVILISRYAGNVHLDIDAVLVGELAFAPFDRLIILGRDVGPRGLYVMLGILLINVAFISIFYKELKLTTFDAGLATALGFAPALLHYALMSLVSLTVVGAFDIVGSILVVALIVAPPAAAYLLTDQLGRMFFLSVLIGGVSAISGYWLANLMDASIAGSMATMTGVIFFLVFLFAPEKGLVSAARRRTRQKWEFAQTMLTIHLFNHENTSEALQESRFEHLREHLRWTNAFSAVVVKRAVDSRLIVVQNNSLTLTDSGRDRAQSALAA